MGKPTANVLRRNCQQRLLEGFEQGREGPGLEAAQVGLNFRPGQFNVIEVRRVWGQVEHLCPTRLDQVIMKRLALGLLCLLLTACSFTFQGTKYNAVRYQYGMWMWIERADGTYERWMVNAVSSRITFTM